MKKYKPSYHIRNLLCEQCGGTHYVREVKVYNSKENDVIFLCGYCDHINSEEIKKITQPSAAQINAAYDKLVERRKQGKKKPHARKLLSFEDIEKL